MWVFIFHRLWSRPRYATSHGSTTLTFHPGYKKTDHETNYYSQPLENVPYCTAAMHTQWGISQYPTDCMWFMEGTQWVISTPSSASQAQLSLRPWSCLLDFDWLTQLCLNLQPAALERRVLLCSTCPGRQSWGQSLPLLCFSTHGSRVKRKQRLPSGGCFTERQMSADFKSMTVQIQTVCSVVLVDAVVWCIYKPSCCTKSASV